MSELTRIVGLGIVVSLLLTFLRKEVAPVGAQVAVAFVVIVLIYLIEPLRQALGTFVELADQARVRPLYLALIMKAIGIAYISSIGAELSRDAGEGAIAAIVELAGKIYILVLAVPVIAAILEALVTLLPS